MEKKDQEKIKKAWKDLKVVKLKFNKQKIRRK